MPKCGNQFLDIFLTFCWMFLEISGPLSHAAYRKVLLIKIPGPLKPARHTDLVFVKPIFFRGPESSFFRGG